MKMVEYIDLFEAADMAQRRLAVITVDSGQEGPTIWLAAGCHGDEVTSVAVIHRVLEILQERPLVRGKLHAIPLMNAAGGELIQRNVPIDNENLNRVYPGDPHGGFTERVADKIFSRIASTSPDLVLDLHTTDTRSLPHVILDRFTDREVHPGIEERLMQAAQAFGITVVYDFPMKEYVEQKLNRSLPGALLNHSKLLAYTVELGPTRFVSDPFLQVGVRGVFKMLDYLDMLKENEELPALPVDEAGALGPVLASTTPLRRDRDVQANSTGIVQFLVRPGEAIKEGQTLALVKNVLGDVVETMVAERDGYVLQLADRAVVLPGIPALTLAIPDL